MTDMEANIRLIAIGVGVGMMILSVVAVRSDRTTEAATDSGGSGGCLGVLLAVGGIVVILVAISGLGS